MINDPRTKSLEQATPRDLNASGRRPVVGIIRCTGTHTPALGGKGQRAGEDSEPDQVSANIIHYCICHNPPDPCDRVHTSLLPPPPPLDSPAIGPTLPPHPPPSPLSSSCTHARAPPTPAGVNRCVSGWISVSPLRRLAPLRFPPTPPPHPLFPGTDLHLELGPDDSSHLGEDLNKCPVSAGLGSERTSCSWLCALTLRSSVRTASLA